MLAQRGMLLTDGDVSIIFTQVNELWQWQGEIRRSMYDLRRDGIDTDGGLFNIRNISTQFFGMARITHWHDTTLANFVGSGPLKVGGEEVELPPSRWFEVTEPAHAN